jgi:hypothetical protein
MGHNPNRVIYILLGLVLRDELLMGKGSFIYQIPHHQATSHSSIYNDLVGVPASNSPGKYGAHLSVIQFSFLFSLHFILLHNASLLSPIFVLPVQRELTPVLVGGQRR